MKKHYYILLILLLLLLCGVGYGLSRRALSENEKIEKNNQQVIEDEDEDDDNEEVEQKEHLLKLTIIGPEGETIFPGQARMYNALLEGNQKYEYTRIRCNWKFYLNENNEEVLIQEMENTSAMSGESKEVCGFTSTFIERVGKLRVVLNITLHDATQDLESVEAERVYTVTK